MKLHPWADFSLNLFGISRDRETHGGLQIIVLRVDSFFLPCFEAISPSVPAAVPHTESSWPREPGAFSSFHLPYCWRSVEITEMCHLTWLFLCGFWSQAQGYQACVVNLLSTEPSPWLHNWAGLLPVFVILSNRLFIHQFIICSVCF